ncbi:MAG: 2-phosphosulfolactate phosphatase [Deinococcales bacterium]|jgi:2-phosphosulfolactate phosphatase
MRVSLDLLPPAALHENDVAIVVDVLRMTTTATVLAELGLARLSVVADVERARERARSDGALLLGERDARPLPGFDGGNSPLEYTGVAVQGRAAVLCTTNGSSAVEACAGARHVLLGSLRNAHAVAQRTLALASDHVLLVCAGTEGALSLDDVVAAGRIVAALQTARPDAALDDAALLAREAARGDLETLLASSRHGRTLVRAGFAGDLAEAARLDITDVVLERLGRSTDTFRVGRARPDVQ